MSDSVGIDPFAPFAQDRATELTGRQDEVFQQIFDLYLESGFSRFTLEQVAAQLRTSKSTIYALAPSREQLATSVAVAFFRRAAIRIDEKIARETTASGRLEVYLRGVAEELEALSPQFMDDLSAFEPTRRIYQLNTTIAASRIRDLVAAGVETDEFRAISVPFVAELISSVMVSIQGRSVSRATGLSDASAYSALADLVLRGIQA